MFEGFEPFALTTQLSPEVVIRGLRSPNHNQNLPPLLLLHGFPQTLHIWHRVAPRLTDAFHLVLFDLRGYGSSSKPKAPECVTAAIAAAAAAEKDDAWDENDHDSDKNDDDDDGTAQYAKSCMASDCVSVMDQLGYRSFYVCGHDRGGRVAHKLCVDHPARVRKAIVLDICPTLAMYEAATDPVFATAYYHWFLLVQPAPLPEAMILGHPRAVAARFMGGRQRAGLRIFDRECWETHYLGALSDPDTVHAMCQDYRAAATWDLDEQRADAAEGRRIRAPLRVLWGRHGVVERCFDALAEWRKVAEPGVAVDGHAVDSGHYLPEEVPDTVVAEIRDFFS